MKKLLLLTVSLLFFKNANSQSWLPEHTGTTKYDDIIERFRNTPDTEKEDDEANENDLPREGKNYHFERWAWYWQNHLDENGNLASPLRTFEAWQQLKLSKAATARFKTTNQAQWSFVGPSSSPGGYRGIGRINNIGFHPTDSNTFIVATAGGGAWRTTNGGQSWTCLTDQLPVLGTSDVDYNPLNPNTIYLCTGDRDASDTYSLGVLKSTDGGVTWDTTGLIFKRNDLRLTNALVINPKDTNSLTLATSVGMMKSYNGGQTWSTTAAGHFKEVVYHPLDTNIMYAATVSPGAIYRSVNGGSTWQQTLAPTNAGRISIAVTPAAPSIVKAVVSRSSDNGLEGIYHAADTGKTFTKIFGNPNDCSTNILNGSNTLSGSSCGGQGWYDLSIAISPVDANKIFVGGVNTYRSMNGGSNWTIVNQWFGGMPGLSVVHADKHMLAFNPVAPAAVYECNDGGIYRSYNVNLWTDLTNGLQNTQFYRLATSDMASFVVAGAQDNGTKAVDFNGSSTELTGGDGMDCQIDFFDPNTFYTSTQYGNFNRTTDGGNSFTGITIPGNPTGPWITPLQLSYQSSSWLFAGYQHVFFSPDMGNSWTDISPMLSNSADITRLSLSPQDQNRILALQGSVIRYTKDFGNTWSPVSSLFGSNISDILMDPLDTNRLYVTYGGFGSTKVAQYVFGSGWTKIQDSLPNIPIQCITKDVENGTLYIGTDIGVFYKDTASTHWQPFNTGLPVIEVTDLSINYTTNEVWASTYGRGIWKSPRYTINTGIGSIPLALNVISVAPNPAHNSFTLSTDNDALKTQSVIVRLVGYDGKVVRILENKFDGSGRLQVPTADIAPGTYIVEVQSSHGVAATSKVILF